VAQAVAQEVEVAEEVKAVTMNEEMAEGEERDEQEQMEVHMVADDEGHQPPMEDVAAPAKRRRTTPVWLPIQYTRPAFSATQVSPSPITHRTLEAPMPTASIREDPALATHIQHTPLGHLVGRTTYSEQELRGRALETLTAAVMERSRPGGDPRGRNDRHFPDPATFARLRQAPDSHIWLRVATDPRKQTASFMLRLRCNTKSQLITLHGQHYVFVTMIGEFDTGVFEAQAKHSMRYADDISHSNGWSLLREILANITKEHQLQFYITTMKRVGFNEVLPDTSISLPVTSTSAYWERDLRDMTTMSPATGATGDKDQFRVDTSLQAYGRAHAMESRDQLEHTQVYFHMSPGPVHPSRVGGTGPRSEVVQLADFHDANSGAHTIMRNLIDTVRALTTREETGNTLRHYEWRVTSFTVETKQGRAGAYSSIASCLEAHSSPELWHQNAEGQHHTTTSLLNYMDISEPQPARYPRGPPTRTRPGNAYLSSAARCMLLHETQNPARAQMDLAELPEDEAQTYWTLVAISQVPVIVSFPALVAPGQTTELSIDMTDLYLSNYRAHRDDEALHIRLCPTPQQVTMDRPSAAVRNEAPTSQRKRHREDTPRAGGSTTTPTRHGTVPRNRGGRATHGWKPSRRCQELGWGMTLAALTWLGTIWAAPPRNRQTFTRTIGPGTLGTLLLLVYSSTAQAAPKAWDAIAREEVEINRLAQLIKCWALHRTDNYDPRLENGIMGQVSFEEEDMKTLNELLGPLMPEGGEPDDIARHLYYEAHGGAARTRQQDRYLQVRRAFTNVEIQLVALENQDFHEAISHEGMDTEHSTEQAVLSQRALPHRHNWHLTGETGMHLIQAFLLRVGMVPAEAPDIWRTIAVHTLAAAKIWFQAKDTKGFTERGVFLRGRAQMEYVNGKQRLRSVSPPYLRIEIEGMPTFDYEDEDIIQEMNRWCEDDFATANGTLGPGFHRNDQAQRYQAVRTTYAPTTTTVHLVARNTANLWRVILAVPSFRYRRPYWQPDTYAEGYPITIRPSPSWDTILQLVPAETHRRGPTPHRILYAVGLDRAEAAHVIVGCLRRLGLPDVQCCWFSECDKQGKLCEWWEGDIYFSVMSTAQRNAIMRNFPRSRGAEGTESLLALHLHPFILGYEHWPEHGTAGPLASQAETLRARWAQAGVNVDLLPGEGNANKQRGGKKGQGAPPGQAVGQEGATIETLGLTYYYFRPLAAPAEGQQYRYHRTRYLYYRHPQFLRWMRLAGDQESEPLFVYVEFPVPIRQALSTAFQDRSRAELESSLRQVAMELTQLIHGPIEEGGHPGTPASDVAFSYDPEMDEWDGTYFILSWQGHDESVDTDLTSTVAAKVNGLKTSNGKLGPTLTSMLQGTSKEDRKGITARSTIVTLNPRTAYRGRSRSQSRGRGNQAQSTSRGRDSRASSTSRENSADSKKGKGHQPKDERGRKKERQEEGKPKAKPTQPQPAQTQGAGKPPTQVQKQSQNQAPNQPQQGTYYNALVGGRGRGGRGGKGTAPTRPTLTSHLDFMEQQAQVRNRPVVPILNLSPPGAVVPRTRRPPGQHVAFSCVNNVLRSAEQVRNDNQEQKDADLGLKPEAPQPDTVIPPEHPGIPPGLFQQLQEMQQQRAADMLQMAEMQQTIRQLSELCQHLQGQVDAKSGKGGKQEASPKRKSHRKNQGDDRDGSANTPGSEDDDTSGMDAEEQQPLGGNAPDGHTSP